MNKIVNETECGCDCHNIKCEDWGHEWTIERCRFANPFDKDDLTKEYLCRCSVCGKLDDHWV